MRYRTRFVTFATAALMVLALVSGQASAQTLTTLASFNGSNGANPFGSLTLSPDGSSLYGMTNLGGDYDKGTVFSLTLPEPSTFALLGIGSAALLAWGWWRRRGK